jgi:hypothetical protein
MRILALLAPDATTAPLAGLGTPLPVGATVTVVVGSALGSNGWDIDASEIVTLPSGLSYIAIMCLPAQASQDAGNTAVRTIFAQLATLAQS